MQDTTSDLIGIFGAGGFGREVMPIARAMAGPDTEVVFVDNAPPADVINGHRVLTEDAFWQAEATTKRFNVAVGDSALRRKIAENAMARGVEPITLTAPTAIFQDALTIGPGAVFCAHSIVNSNATIGRFFQSNLNCYVAHDCVIGDYVTFAPNVACNGNVQIGDLAYVGTGAILRHGSPGNPLRIGEGAVIGMGAVVTRNVEPYTTVVGNPARPFTKR